MNDLTTIVKENNLSQDFASKLQNSFTPFFEQARQMSDEAKKIVVTSQDQKDLMTNAREKRLKLKAIRVEVENKRKELKDESLRTSRAIDGMANIIKFLIVPIEEHLQLQEDFIKIQEERSKKELGEKRIAELAEFGLLNPEYDLENMSESGYNTLLDTTKIAHEHRAKELQKAEEDRIERERKVELYRSRKEQLIPYWSFLRGDQPSIDFGEIPEESFQIILKEVKTAQKQKEIDDEKIRVENEKLKKEKEEKEKAHAAEQKKLQENLQREKEKTEKLEKQAREQKEAERKALEEKQKQEKEEELAKLKAEKEAQLAPDKEKMRGVYANLSKVLRDIQMTTFETAEARSIAGDAIESLQNIQTNIMERMKKLSE